MFTVLGDADAFGPSDLSIPAFTAVSVVLMHIGDLCDLRSDALLDQRRQGTAARL